MNKTIASCMAMALLLLSGCAGFEVADEVPKGVNPGKVGQVIGFNTLAVEKTRAANEMFTNYGVFANWSGNGATWYMDHVQVNGSNNSYSPLKYWPSGTLSFYAYAPFNSTNVRITSSTVGQLPVTYTVPGSDAVPGLASEDFTIALPLNAKTYEDGAMALAFQHMLSRVTVNAVLSSALTGYSLDLSRATVVLKVAQNSRTTTLTNVVPAWNTGFATGSTPATYKADFTQSSTTITPPTFRIMPQPAYDGAAVLPATKSKVSVQVKNGVMKYQQNRSLSGDLIVYNLAENVIANNTFEAGKHYTITLQVNRTGQLWGTFTDNRDGNLYKTVIIGHQIWMAENLRYLPSVQNYSDITRACHYVYGYNGTSTTEAKATPNYSKYGVLYNWFAAMAGRVESIANPSGVKGICPEGWHLPSEAEWLQLSNYLNGSGDDGGVLKEEGTLHWESPNTGATNEFGFTALPGGYRGDASSFTKIKTNGHWWSTTADNGNSCARYFYLSHGNANAEIFYEKNTQNKGWGLSVRCVRD